VHYCDEQYDTGHIILQGRCPVLAGDTPDALAARVFGVECDTYPKAISMVLRNI
jgi:phosphoribosylglycinamide formyltransferase-1